jgi:hypothetical protein
LWNGRDPILKERAFGLTGSQGNHGEDVNGALAVSGCDSGLGGCGWVIGAVRPLGDGIKQIAGPAGRFTVTTVEPETAGL